MKEPIILVRAVRVEPVAAAMTFAWKGSMRAGEEVKADDERTRTDFGTQLSMEANKLGSRLNPVI